MKAITAVPTLALVALVSGCVSAKKHNALLDNYGQTQQELAALEKSANELADTTYELSTDNLALQADKAELEEALRMLREDNKLADARIAAYEDLTAKFADMIDAGELSVKIIDGRMVVELASDILFDSGSAQLSNKGRDTLQRAGEILSSVDRSFQVEGHTDDDPISTAKYPSNWELAAGRSITVVQALHESGVSLDNLSAASFADEQPVASNEVASGKAMNRRIEIVVMPDLSQLPGAERLNSLASN